MANTVLWSLMAPLLYSLKHINTGIEDCAQHSKFPRAIRHAKRAQGNVCASKFCISTTMRSKIAKAGMNLDILTNTFDADQRESVKMSLAEIESRKDIEKYLFSLRSSLNYRSFVCV